MGDSITNPILRNADGVWSKKVNNWKLHQLITAVMGGAARPDPIDIRKQITDVMAFIFDWKETGATNQERLAADIVKAVAFGVVNDITATIMLANIAMAARCSSGIQRGEAQHKIRAKYQYNHVHSDVSIKWIMAELATADKQQDCTEMKTPSRGGMANLVTDWPQQLVLKVGEETSDSESESAMVVTSDSESSAERKSNRRRGEKEVVQKPYRRAASPSKSTFPS